MIRFIYFALSFLVLIVCLGCPGVGKTDREAAEATVLQLKELYPEEILDVKVFRDKLQIAFPKDLHPMKKSSIFQDAAVKWWMAYPDDKKPGHKLYCWAYNDVISDDDIGSLTMTQGVSPSAPRVEGQPGIYALRDIK
ncbi:hypothetical protein KKB99_00465 [bacterium]|nr:hypothetical protein [bacterium]MBU1024458.1 hypothetical protein [bacterium]